MPTTRRHLLAATAVGLVAAGCSTHHRRALPPPIDPALARDDALRRRAVLDETNLLALTESVLASDPGHGDVLHTIADHHRQHLLGLGGPTRTARAVSPNLLADARLGLTPTPSSAPTTGGPTSPATHQPTPTPPHRTPPPAPTAVTTPPVVVTPLATIRTSAPEPTGPSVGALAAAEAAAAGHRGADMRAASSTLAPVLGSLSAANMVHVALLRAALG